MAVEQSDFLKRLKNARIMNGLSMDALCKKMGNIVSKVSISKYENGKMKADSSTVIAFSKALDVPVDYFLSRLLFRLSQ